MRSTRTYLDHNATAPLRPEAREAMLIALDAFGNPSSVHAEGRRTRALVEEAREQVAQLIGARAEEVVFTSGASEANAWIVRAGWDAIIAAGIEHESVLAPARTAAGRLLDLPVGRDGSPAPAEIARALSEAARRGGHVLLSLQLANNETGALQPVREAVVAARACGAIVHTDAVQAAGRVPIDFRDLDVDALSLSAHKLGGPKGVGALVLREGLSPAPLIGGGGQERRRRAGTENVPGIAGFGAAAAAAGHDLARVARIERLRDRLEQGALAATPEAVVVGAGVPRLSNTTCLALPGAAAETLVIRLDLAGIAVSAGAACSSGKVGASSVLAAMDLPAEIARSAIRVSLGWSTTESDVDAFLAAWSAIAGKGLKRAVA